MHKYINKRKRTHTHIYIYIFIFIFIFTYIYIYIMIEGSWEVKLPIIWADRKAEVEESEKRREEKRRGEERREEKRREDKRREEERREEKRREADRRSKKRKSQKKEDAAVRQGSKVTIHCDFPMICGSGGSKSRLAKAAGAEPFGQMRDEHFHTVVARSTFPSQIVQSTPGSDHFWKLTCRKSARRCGAKHMWKSNCTKHTRFGLGPLLEVDMPKKCKPLWREARFQVKMCKVPQCRTTFGSYNVQKVHASVVRSTFGSQHAQKTPCSDHFWKLRCRKSVRRCGAKQISKSKV